MADTKRPRGPKHSLQTVLAAIKDSFGVRATIAHRLQVTRQTVMNYEKRWAKVREAMAEEENTILDIAERQLYMRVVNGQEWAVKYMLNNRGRARGWGQQNDIEVTPPAQGGLIYIEGPKETYVARTRDLARDGLIAAGVDPDTIFEPDTSLFADMGHRASESSGHSSYEASEESEGL